MDRRTFLAKSAAAAASIAMIEPLAAQTTRKKTFTILHTNDLHSNLVGMAPVSDPIGAARAAVATLRNTEKVDVVMFAMDQPLARIEKDLTNASSDLAASTILANLCTDAFRKNCLPKARLSRSRNGRRSCGIFRHCPPRWRENCRWFRQTHGPMSSGSSGSADRLVKYSNNQMKLAYSRWYSLTKAFFDRSWKMGNIKEIR